MAQTICILLDAEDRTRLAAIVGDRNRPYKYIQRARIVVLSADRLPVLEVARQTGVSRPAVWRWQHRFAEEGVDGLLRDKTRKPGKKPLPATTVAKILALPCGEPPGQATHWTGRMVAKAVGVSLRAVQRVWEANRLQPHRLRQRPGLCRKGRRRRRPLHAPARPCRRRPDRREIALDRTQPGLPMKPGKCGTMTHDYKRNATTTLFAALNILDGTVLGRCMPSHT